MYGGSVVEFPFGGRSSFSQAFHCAMSAPAAKRARVLGVRALSEDALAEHYRRALEYSPGPALFPGPHPLDELISRASRPDIAPLLEQACLEIWRLGVLDALGAPAADCSFVGVDFVTVGWNFLHVGFSPLRYVAPVSDPGARPASCSDWAIVADLLGDHIGPDLGDGVLLLLLAARRAGLVVSGLDLSALPVFAGHFENGCVRVMFRMDAGRYLASPRLLDGEPRWWSPSWSLRRSSWRR